MQLTTAVLALLASIATPALADCQLVNSGPGEEAGKAVFDFFIRDFVQPQFYDKVCPLGQERESSPPPPTSKTKRLLNLLSSILHGPVH